MKSLVAALLLTFAPSAAALAQSPSHTAETGAAENATQYCTNVANAAGDARFARQAAALADMEKQVQERIDQLEAKRAEYEAWLRRREDFLKRADESVTAMFSQMRPDAAAAQLTVMSDEVAGAILAKLNPRVSSAILNEMEPARAARLTGTMVGIAKRTQS